MNRTMAHLTPRTSMVHTLALASLVLLAGCQDTETTPQQEAEKIESQATFTEASVLNADESSEDTYNAAEEPTEEFEEVSPLSTAEGSETWEEAAFFKEDMVWEEEIPSECDWDYSWYAADQFVTYSDPERGITFDFRTKKAWWDEGHGELPYALIPVGSETHLRFGPVGTLDGCDLPQYYFMTVEPRRSTDSILKALEKETWSKPVPTPYTLNGNEAVLYESSGLCEHPQLEIVGPTANYVFYPLCGNENEIKVLLKLGEGVNWL